LRERVTHNTPKYTAREEFAVSEPRTASTTWSSAAPDLFPDEYFSVPRISLSLLVRPGLGSVLAVTSVEY
jgi:hypothetical protein